MEDMMMCESFVVLLRQNSDVVVKIADHSETSDNMGQGLAEQAPANVANGVKNFFELWVFSEYATRSGEHLRGEFEPRYNLSCIGVENLDRCRIFDSTDFEKLDETTSKKHFRRKFFLREVGDQKVSSQEILESTRRARGFWNHFFLKFISGISKIIFQNLFRGFQNLQTWK